MKNIKGKISIKEDEFFHLFNHKYLVKKEKNFKKEMDIFLLILLFYLLKLYFYYHLSL